MNEQDKLDAQEKGWDAENEGGRLKKEELLYVWFSEKQYQHYFDSKNDDFKPNEALLENGKIVIYTEMTVKDKPSGAWDDYKLLGRGKWLRKKVWS